MSKESSMEASNFRKVSADIKLPVYNVEILVKKDADDNEIREALLTHAEYLREIGSGWDPLVENFENVPASNDDLKNSVLPIYQDGIAAFRVTIITCNS